MTKPFLHMRISEIPAPVSRRYSLGRAIAYRMLPLYTVVLEILEGESRESVQYVEKQNIPT